jgi:hypothetical protein
LQLEASQPVLLRVPAPANALQPSMNILLVSSIITDLLDFLIFMVV